MDWNNDGLIDILTGDAAGKLTVFLNTNNNINPIMDNGSIITTGTGGRSTPEVNDWNGDGRKDMLVGLIQGTVAIYINEGTDASPFFNSPYNLQLNGADFNIDTRAAPRVTDWNNDGLKDLLIGTITGYIYMLENVGTNNSPVFNTANKLLYKGVPLNHDTHSRLFITDWNNDGLNDLLVGGANGKVMLFIMG